MKPRPGEGRGFNVYGGGLSVDHDSFHGLALSDDVHAGGEAIGGAASGTPMVMGAASPTFGLRPSRGVRYDLAALRL